jgi:hypothetical protein
LKKIWASISVCRWRLAAYRWNRLQGIKPLDIVTTGRAQILHTIHKTGDQARHMGDRPRPQPISIWGLEVKSEPSNCHACLPVWDPLTYCPDKTRNLYIYFCLQWAG